MQYQMLTKKGALGRLPFIGVDKLDYEQSRIVFQGQTAPTPRQPCTLILERI